MKASIVDDQATARLVLREILERWQFQIVEADSGEDAVAAALLAQKANTPFDLIIMDWKMSGVLDSLDLIHQIHQFQEEGVALQAKTPVLIISFYSQNDLLAQVAEYTTFLEKPVTPSALFNAFIEATNGSLSPTQNTLLRISSFSSYTILLVEDNT